MPHNMYHVYIEPDGTASASTIPSNSIVDGVSVAAAGGAVLVAGGGLAGPAFMAPLLLMAGQPGGYGAALAGTVGGLLPPRLVIPAFILLAGISFFLGLYNLVWGLRAKLRAQRFCRQALSLPQLRELIRRYERENELEHRRHSMRREGLRSPVSSKAPAAEHGH